MQVAGAEFRVGFEVDAPGRIDRQRAETSRSLCWIQLEVFDAGIEFELVHRGAFFRRFYRAVTLAVSVVVHVRLVHTVKQIVVAIVMRCVTSA